MRSAVLMLRIASFVFTFGAADFWLFASIDKAPLHTKQNMERIGGADIFGSHQAQLVDAVIRQSRLNAAAAGCAAAAGFAQLGLGLLGAFS
jgi:hypothetical protein